MALFTPASFGNCLLPVLEDAIRGAIKGSPCLMGSTAVVERPGLPVGPSGRPKKTVRMPYFTMIGEYEEILVEGNGVAPKAFEIDGEDAEVRHFALGIDLSNFAVDIADPSMDPYAEAGRQLRIREMEKLDKLLIEAAVVATPTGYTLDESSADLEFDMIRDAEALWGDESDKFASELFVHPDVRLAMAKMKDEEKRYYLREPKDPGGPTTVWGKRLTQSSRMPAPVEGVYTSLLSWPGALGIWRAPPKLLVQQDAASNTEATYSHIYVTTHRYSRHPVSAQFPMIHIKHKIPSTF